MYSPLNRRRHGVLATLAVLLMLLEGATARADEIRSLPLTAETKVPTSMEFEEDEIPAPDGGAAFTRKDATTLAAAVNGSNVLQYFLGDAHDRTDRVCAAAMFYNPEDGGRTCAALTSSECLPKDGGGKNVETKIVLRGAIVADVNYTIHARNVAVLHGSGAFCRNNPEAVRVCKPPRPGAKVNYLVRDIRNGLQPIELESFGEQTLRGPSGYNKLNLGTAVLRKLRGGKVCLAAIEAGVYPDGSRAFERVSDDVVPVSLPPPRPPLAPWSSVQCRAFESPTSSECARSVSHR